MEVEGWLEDGARLLDWKYPTTIDSTMPLSFSTIFSWSEGSITSDKFLSFEKRKKKR